MHSLVNARDLPTPEQFDATAVGPEALPGIRALFAELILDAILCVRGESGGPCAKRDAQDWLDGEPAAFSFALVCETLDLDPAQVRAAVRAHEGKPWHLPAGLRFRPSSQVSMAPRLEPAPDELRGPQGPCAALPVLAHCPAPREAGGAAPRAAEAAQEQPPERLPPRAWAQAVLGRPLRAYERVWTLSAGAIVLGPRGYGRIVAAREQARLATGSADGLRCQVCGVWDLPPSVMRRHGGALVAHRDCTRCTRKERTADMQAYRDLTREAS